MLEIIQAYKNLILQTLLSISLTLLIIFLKLPILFLHNLFTYVQPENLNNNNGAKAAIRRPSNDSNSGLEGYKHLSSSSKQIFDAKKRNNRSKDNKFEFDENNAQIFRLKLDEGHLQSRLYFNEYKNCFLFSFLSFASLLLSMYLGRDENHGIFANGLVVCLVFGFVALCKIIVALAKVLFERSASKKSEKRLSLILGGLGFVFGFGICAGIVSGVFDFNLGSIDGFWCVFVSFVMACIAGFLYIPAGRSARSYWLGTDQIRCNLSMISCGWFGRMILYANYIAAVFASLLWINPSADMLVQKSTTVSAGGGKILVGNVGMSPSDFDKFRLWCLLLSGLLQIIAVRPNLQMFLNEAVLSWYQRLHASKVPDLDFSRAKMFLHNHYLCLVVLQFFAPPLLVLLFLGLSQIDGMSFGEVQLVCGSMPCFEFFKEVAVLIAWWLVFVWSVFASASLLFYRHGILYVS